MGFWPQLHEWTGFRGILGHILPTAMFKDSIARGKKMKTSAKDNLGVCRRIMRKYTSLWCKDIGSWQLYSEALSSKKFKIMCGWLINGELFQQTAAPETLFILDMKHVCSLNAEFFLQYNIVFKNWLFRNFNFDTLPMLMANFHVKCCEFLKEFAGSFLFCIKIIHSMLCGIRLLFFWGIE